MKKVLVAVLCLFFFGACTQKNEVEQTEIPQNSLELAVRSGEGVVPVNIPASVFDLTDVMSEQRCEPEYFAQDEKISFSELISGRYTFFVLGNNTEEQHCSLFLRDKDKKILELYWEDYMIPELLGGVIHVDGSNVSETVEMTRLVGGVEVKVLNKDEFTALHISMFYMGQDSIRLNDYILVPQRNHYALEEGALVYHFPSTTPIKGEIIAYDEYKNEYYFDFESTKCVERNKKLELNITLERASALARSGSVRNTVTCVEKVSEL